MKDQATRDEEARLTQRMREYLKEFPFYNPDHWVSTNIHDEGISISYGPTSNRPRNIGKTQFDIEIVDATCFILGFEIERSKRRQGYGTQLHKIIERFCIEELKCRRYQTHASAESTRGFRAAMGFQAVSDRKLVKVL